MRLNEISSLKLFCCKLVSHKMFCCKNFCHKNVARKAKQFPERERKKKGRGAAGGHAAHLLVVRGRGRHGHPPRRRPLWPRPQPHGPAPVCARRQAWAQSHFLGFFCFFLNFFF